MGIMVDLIIIAILAICIYSGYRRGLAKCLLKILTSILAIIVALILYKPFVNFVIDSTTIDTSMAYSIERFINQNIGDDNTVEVNDNSGIPQPITKYINTNLKESVDTQKEKAVSEVSKNVSILIINIACVIIIYIIAKILLKIITVFVDIVSKLPVIKQCNELGGIIYGVLEGIIILLIIATLISTIAPLIGNTEISVLISNSYIGKFIYNNNILLNLIF